MAQTRRPATKSKRKSRVKKARSVVRRKRTIASSSLILEAEPSPVVLRRPARGEDAKRVAVINCVNGALDANRPGWNRDGRGNGRTMDKDFHYDVHGMPAFLGVVSRCLAPTYALTIDSTLVQACVPATVTTMKFLVNNNAR
jgi:hypothetical protein